MTTSITSSGNSSLDTISNAYTATDTSETDDYLGLDNFLTMLVAQLENQDPLNPMEGTDFSSQLAEFSQLEQLISLNQSMTDMASAFETQSGGDVVGLIGKSVTGNHNSLQVSNGDVTSGFYNLTQLSDVIIDIVDADGNSVTRLYPGQQEAGSHVLSWDGTDSAGNAVEDGNYYYTVYADSGYGYQEVSTSLAGTVDGITYQDGKAYLVVQGILLDPDSVTSVSDAEYVADDSTSILDYLGTDISSGSPIVLVEDGVVSGSDLTFELDAAEAVTITVYNVFDEEVATIEVSADDTQSGENSAYWNAVGASGYQVEDGIYYYLVKTESGDYASTPVSGEVTGIKYINGGQYLVLEDTGRLVSQTNVDEINTTSEDDDDTGSEDQDDTESE